MIERLKSRHLNLKTKRLRKTISKMSISILQWNIPRMSQKKDELLGLIHSCDSSIITLHETKLSDEFNICIPNYVRKVIITMVEQHGGVAPVV